MCLHEHHYCEMMKKACFTLQSRKLSVVDPLTDDEKLQKLAGETERLSKVVEGLDRRSLNGPTNLELKWKEMVDGVVRRLFHLPVYL